MKSKTLRKWTRTLRMMALLLLLSMALLSCSATAVRGGDGENEDSDKGDIPVSGDGKMRVALTFDDGPHNVRTKLIVDELDKYGFHATFFVVGNRVDGTEYNGGDAMLYALEAGNEVGIHGYTHRVYYDDCPNNEYAKEMTGTKTAIRGEQPGYQIKLMRPVGCAISEERIRECPYSVVLWDVDSEGWRYKYSSGDSDAECEEKLHTIVNNVLENVKDGSIILMHDIYESTYDAVVIILERLNEMGYEVVTVSELLGEEREAGRVYESGRD